MTNYQLFKAIYIGATSVIAGIIIPIFFVEPKPTPPAPRPTDDEIIKAGAEYCRVQKQLDGVRADFKAQCPLKDKACLNRVFASNGISDYNSDYAKLRTLFTEKHALNYQTSQLPLSNGEKNSLDCGEIINVSS